jgi:hypothetical protein
MKSSSSSSSSTSLRRWRLIGFRFLLFQFLPWLPFSAFCQTSFYLAFTAPTNASPAGVIHYDAWWQTTTGPATNQPAWFGQCAAGETNIDIPNSQWPNPVRIFCTSSSGNQTSGFSAPVIFDTNDFPPTPPLSPPGRITLRRR